MPIVLKKKTSQSPGIIVFTHNEILRGVPRKSKKIDNLLFKSSQNKSWIFGVHIQGDCSNVVNWPYREWQDFFLWPNKSEKFLEKVPTEKIFNLTCVNFLPDNIEKFKSTEKHIDIISVTRFSSIKNIHITINIFKELIDLNPNYKFLLIAPKEIPEKKFFQNKESIYFNKVQNTINEIKNSKKYDNIKFLTRDIKTDGLFPLQDKEIYNYIGKSKYLMLNSYREGVPRALVEALCLDTKVIISNKLKYGLSKYFNKENSFIYDEQSKKFKDLIKEINEELKLKNNFMKKNSVLIDFRESQSIKKLINFLKEISLSKNLIIEEQEHQSWNLENLKYRLACHFKEQNHQIIKNEKLFLKWFKNANEDDNYSDEKYSYLFKQDNFDIFLEIKFFIRRLIKLTLRKFKIK